MLLSPTRVRMRNADVLYLAIAALHVRVGYEKNTYGSLVNIKCHNRSDAPSAFWAAHTLLVTHIRMVFHAKTVDYILVVVFLNDTVR